MVAKTITCSFSLSQNMLSEIKDVAEAMRKRIIAEIMKI